MHVVHRLALISLFLQAKMNYNSQDFVPFADIITWDTSDVFIAYFMAKHQRIKASMMISLHFSFWSLIQTETSPLTLSVTSSYSFSVSSACLWSLCAPSVLPPGVCGESCTSPWARSLRYTTWGLSDLRLSCWLLSRSRLLALHA